MDTFTANHFSTWLHAIVHEWDRDRVEKEMLGFMKENPEFPGERSWPEIRDLAEGFCETGEGGTA